MCVSMSLCLLGVCVAHVFYVYQQCVYVFVWYTYVFVCYYYMNLIFYSKWCAVTLCLAPHVKSGM